MRKSKVIRDRYVRNEVTRKLKVLSLESVMGFGFQTYRPNTDPKSSVFMLGLILHLDPGPEREPELFPGGEVLICD
jgi:hypothetical protein